MWHPWWKETSKRFSPSGMSRDLQKSAGSTSGSVKLGWRDKVDLPCIFTSVSSGQFTIISGKQGWQFRPFEYLMILIGENETMLPVRYINKTESKVTPKMAVFWKEPLPRVAILSFYNLSHCGIVCPPRWKTA